MKFLSDILAKAGLTVDGVVTLNNTATGQTPAANDNSTKLATTAWVRGFVTPYSLPIASGTILGGIKIGSGLSIDGTGIVSVAASGVGAIRSLQQITATAGQTVFTVSGGYTPGLIDVFLNGVLLTPTAINSTNGNTFTLADAAVSGDLLDVFVYNPIYNGFISSTDQVPEGLTNLYYTDARARGAISLTVSGSSGSSTYNSTTGVLNIPTYTLTGLGGVSSTRTITINGVTYDLTANRSWSALPTGGTTGQLLAKIDGTDYNAQWIDEAPAASYTSQLKHVVKASQAISKGQAVYVSSADGTNMIVTKASNASEATSSKTMGLLETSLSTNGKGNVITEGLLTGLNTASANAGDPVWLGTDGNLIYGLLNKPTAPAHLVFIGIVTRANANNGEIFVKVQNGFEMGELHDYVQNGVQDNYVISYESSTSLYKPKSIATLLGYTPQAALSGTGFVKINGSTISYDNSVYATETYVNTAVSNLVDAAPTTLDTLNELAAALGDDPNFATTVATSIGTKVPLTRTITINGTSYDLSADRTWNIAAGVTSFNTRTGAITPASGDYTTAQVTESGNLYYTNTRARLAISLTTTGTSGAATYDNVTGVLNIPQYQGGVTSFNTRTGAITLSDTDVTTALTYTPVTNARTITINGTTYDLSADRTWSIAAGLTSFNTRTGDITLTSSDVTTALGYTPVTNARTLTINGTAYDLTADRSWTVGVNPSARTIQTYTATASQTTFTVTGGYVVGLVDVFINGVRLTSADFTATNGSTVVLTTGTGVGNIVDVIKYTSAFTASSALRQVSYFTATAGQTTFTVSYTPGLVDVFYNGSKLASSEYTASNGTSVVLSSGAAFNDVIEIVAYAYSVGAFTGQAQLNGTGFVKVNGTTVSYDNNTYLTSFDASSTYIPYTGAISSIDLGSNAITSAMVYISGEGGGGVLNLKKGTSRTVGGSDAANTISLWADGTTLAFNDWVAGNTRSAKFSVASITNNATRTYTLPNSDGTLALTSNLSSYLPLSGGTLTGNISISTASGSAYMTIETTVSSVNSAQIYFKKGGTAYWDIGAFNMGAAGSNDFSVYNRTTSSNAFTILATNGNLGLGTVSPSHKLTVQADAADMIIWRSPTYITGILGLDTNNSHGALWLLSSGTTKVQISALSSSVTYFNAGAVGIGTSTPYTGSALEVKALSANSLAFQVRATDGNNTVYISPNNSGYNRISSNYMVSGPYLPLSLTARENNSDLVLLTNGNVLIGSTSDNSHRLQVNGNIYSSSGLYSSTGHFTSGALNGRLSSNITGNLGYCLLARLDQDAGWITRGTVVCASWTCWNVSDIYIRKAYASTSVTATISGVAKGGGQDFSIVDCNYGGVRYLAFKFSGGNGEVDVNLTGFGLASYLTMVSFGVTENATLASY